MSDGDSLRNKKHKGRSAIYLALSLILVAGCFVAADHMTTVRAVRSIGALANDYPGGEACSSRLAINANTRSARQHLCSSYCDVHEDCPDDWGCKRIRQGNGDRVGICFPFRPGYSRENAE